MAAPDGHIAADTSPMCIVCHDDAPPSHRVCGCTTRVHPDCSERLVREVPAHARARPVCLHPYVVQLRHVPFADARRLASWLKLAVVGNLVLEFVFVCMLVDSLCCVADGVVRELSALTWATTSISLQLACCASRTAPCCGPSAARRPRSSASTRRRPCRSYEKWSERCRSRDDVTRARGQSARTNLYVGTIQERAGKRRSAS
jgi:hypothetical protein